VQIHIPFSQEYVPLMESDIKTATTRYKRYGQRADFFECRGHLYCISEVKRVYLYRVAQYCFSHEGFSSREAFVHAWNRLHPRRGYRPNDLVYYHRFFRET